MFRGLRIRKEVIMANPYDIGYPTRMIYLSRTQGTRADVLVYDFIHDKRNESKALCWNIEDNYWFTPYVSDLIPKLDVVRKVLVE